MACSYESRCVVNVVSVTQLLILVRRHLLHASSHSTQNTRQRCAQRFDGFDRLAVARVQYIPCS